MSDEPSQFRITETPVRLFIECLHCGRGMATFGPDVVKPLNRFMAEHYECRLLEAAAGLEAKPDA